MFKDTPFFAFEQLDMDLNIQSDGLKIENRLSPKRKDGLNSETQSAVFRFNWQLVQELLLPQPLLQPLPL